MAQSGLLPADLDPDAARGFLRWGVVPSPATLVSGLRRLPPGSYLKYATGTLAVSEWWSQVSAVEARLSEAELAMRVVRTVLTDAVHQHLLAEREVGVFLSGGPDSTVVATLAAERAPVTALTLSFPDDTSLDETAAAKRTAGRLGIKHVVVSVDESGLEGQIRDFLRSLDAPSLDALNSWFICRAASDAGIVVALSGAGADELLGSYPSFQLIPRVQKMSRLFEFLPGKARYAVARGLAQRHRGSRLGRTLLADTSPFEAYTAVRSLFSAADFASGVLPRTDPRRQRWSGPASADEITRMEFDHFLAEQLLRTLIRSLWLTRWRCAFPSLITES